MARISSIAELRRFIDCDRRSKSTNFSIRALLADLILRFKLALRIIEYLLNAGKSIVIRSIPLFYFKRISVRLGFSIPLNVFGEGLAIVHYGTLVVSSFAIIGRNCRIHAGVNIGGGLMHVEDATSKSPIIGDNCYIGPGAKVYGAISIADNCVIGANSVVGRSFPESSKTIAGVPARVISSEGSTGFLTRGWISEEESIQQ